MSLFSPIMCALGRHEPLRRKVSWDGRNYVGHCKHCGKAIERVAHRQWRERTSPITSRSADRSAGAAAKG